MLWRLVFGFEMKETPVVTGDASDLKFFPRFDPKRKSVSGESSTVLKCESAFYEHKSHTSK